MFLSLLSQRFPFFISNDDQDALVEIGLTFGVQRLQHAAKLMRLRLCSIDFVHEVERELMIQFDAHTKDADGFQQPFIRAFDGHTVCPPSEIKAMCEALRETPLEVPMSAYELVCTV
jgi:hypothetical protein